MTRTWPKPGKAGADGLTPIQRTFYYKWTKFLQQYGKPPTIRTMCRILDIRSPNGVMCHIRALISKGLMYQAGAKQWESYYPTGMLVKIEYDGTPAGRRAREIMTLAETTEGKRDG